MAQEKLSRQELLDWLSHPITIRLAEYAAFQSDELRKETIECVMMSGISNGAVRTAQASYTWSEVFDLTTNRERSLALLNEGE